MPDLRLLPPALCAWLTAIAVIAVPGVAPVVALVCGVGAVAATAGLARNARHRGLFLALALGLAAAALVGTAVAVAAPHRAPAPLAQAAAQRGSVTTRAVVLTTPVTAGAERFGSGAERLRFEARLTEYDTGTLRGTAAAPVLVFAEGKRPAIGVTVLLHGTLRATEPGESVAFLFFAERPLTILAHAPGYLAWAEPLRDGLRDRAQALPGDGGDLLPGLAIGDTSAVSGRLDAAMKASSLSHLTAVSGANCAVVIAIILLVGAAIGLPRVARLLLALASLAGFVVLVTPEPSVLRAAVMATIVLSAFASGRPGRGMPALSLAVILLLVADPWLGRSYGFALSVLATAGLLLLAAPLARLLARWLPHPLALAIAVPLAAQVACQPVLVLLDPVIPVAGVAANMLAEPAAPIATILGLLGCLLLPVLPAVGAALLQLAWLPAAWIAAVAQTIAALPLGRLPWLGGLSGAVLLAGVTAITIWLVAHRGRSLPGVSASLAGLLLVGAGVYGGALVGASVVRTLSAPQDWQYAVCDVGQGDAVLVRSEGRVGLIDTGPDPAALERCLSGLGITRVDLLVLTHYHLDHTGGLDAVIGRVDEALVGVPETDADGRLLERLAAGGAAVRRGVAGEGGTLGALAWTVVWPVRGPTVRGQPAQAGNAGSIAMTFAGGLSAAFLSAAFLGDTGEESQAALLERGSVTAVDIVKVAHHGSADQSAELYRRLGARLGLISAGLGNGYGHPTARVLDILAGAGTRIARTDTQGLILVAPSADGVRVWTERPG